MKVIQEKLPASQIGLEIEITPEMSKQAYEKTLQEYMRSVNIPGFRKGKVPRQVLIQRFGSTRIKAAVLEDLIQDGLRQALEQEKIEPIGQPELKSPFETLVEQFQPGAALTFAAAVDVAPEVVVKQYSELKVQAEEFKYDPARVDSMLEDYRKRSATLVPVERPAQAADMATVDFTGQLSGEIPEGESAEIPGGSAQDFEIELSEGKFIKGFTEGVIGMTVGETKAVEVAFPDDYPQADLAGKPAVFTITLKELKERELPELDNEFAEEVSEFETLAELRASLETRLQKEAEQKTTQSKQEALVKALVEQLEVDLPETLLKREVDYSVTQTAMQFAQQGMDIKKTFTPEIVSMLREQARPEALERLKRTLALGEVAKRESVEIEDEAIEAKVAETLVEYAGQDVDEERLREAVAEDLLREKIFAWLEAHNSIELVPEGSLEPDEPEVEAIEAETDPAVATVEVEAVEVVAAVAKPAVAEPAIAEPVVAEPEAASPEPTPEPEAAEPEPKATKAAKSGKSESGKKSKSSKPSA
ncbi:MAG: trigger factor [Pegethrix bostrychoides GSE-TBD4-15B]|jgi:trigger factor|uniref:Trigger factor n=1 Tax=Pegethrix bostrychoides GSE-TBD4-15B TaxID=2839662 RepID=A0A951PC61_9CYAN|nr:trigger factor [Pegethrix bostrychoides GSE-TBD4-15B]